ncbi:magnesium/cobalt transporter CorA [Chitinophaga nivalis]|uniref:Magnesium transport protein CorA n=1 Tax=Chitinophaga nivalis TaxID=2991709 RepID=A0ABT3IVH2_9BACT|nr:magnesium/cobalt transporter CorA [Chitinophaga nivalis]MCW3462413.1 magnesium/cobalt transporter CorA [Chitinophaga nivalis]MCW3487896.1 magnesium/cobalt transporter CorA [Chitinophaga nivalis]
MAAKKNILPIPDVLNPFKVRKERIMNFNPATGTTTRTPAAETKITVFDYSSDNCQTTTLPDIAATFPYLSSSKLSWINIDGLRKEDVHTVCEKFQIHPLIEEDILSVGQRAKMDMIGDRLFCLLPMIYFNAGSATIDLEQVSIVLGKNFVISFQEDPERDVFDPVRDKLQLHGSRIRNGGADYLCYSLLDVIIDNYFVVLDKLGERIELMEDVVQHTPNKRSLARINFLRRQVFLFKRAIAPVRELVNGFLKSESDLLDDKVTKYFKDVYDHIIQCNDLADNYRDMVLNLQEMYHTQLNLKMNEIMKVLAVVTTLMAPLTLIAGIYGMNFENMPELKSPMGYFYTLGAMGILLILMIVLFRKRGWF